MINQCHLLYPIDHAWLIDIVCEEYQFGDSMLLQMHIDIQLHWKKTALAIDHRDVIFLTLQVVVEG